MNPLNIKKSKIKIKSKSSIQISKKKYQKIIQRSLASGFAIIAIISLGEAFSTTPTPLNIPFGVPGINFCEI